MTAEHIRRGTFALVLTFLCFGIQAQEAVRAKLEQYMNGHAKLNGFSGTVLVVRNDEVLLRKAYGLADREWGIANTPDTKFRIASVSKPFTAVAVLKLAEQGKLSLDDKLEKFLPGFPGGDKITLHMMLTHTSGIMRAHDFDVATEMTMTAEKAVEILRKKPLEFEPGTRDGYSNTAFLLLSIIIEKVSGESFAQFMTKNVFQPAGLTDTFVYDPQMILARKARHYRPTEPGLNAPVENEWWFNYAMFQGHGNLISTAGDLEKFARAFRGTALLSEEWKAKMFTNHGEKVGMKMGYGVGIAPQFDRESFHHSGRFNGATSTWTVFPRDKAVIILLSNNGSETFDYYKALSAITFGRDVEMPYEHVAVKIDPAPLAAYAGTYGRHEIVHEGGKLFLNGQEKIELLPESPTRFFQRDDPNRTFDFVAGPDGKVTAVTTTAYGVKAEVPRR